MLLKLTEEQLDLLEELEESSEEQEEEDEEEEDRGDDFDPDDDEEDEEDAGDDTDEDEDDVGEDEDEDEDYDEDDDEEDEEEDAPSDQRVPRSRLNEVIAQREAERERSKWLEEQLAALIKTSSTPKEEEAQKEPPFDFDAAEEQYVDLVLEGDKAAARELRKQIDAAKAREVEAKFAALKEEAASSAKTVSETALQEQKYQKALETALTSYDFLNHESDNYNEKAVKMANKLMNSYVAEGLTKGEALTEAVKDIVPLFGKTDTKKSVDRAKAARKTAVDAAKKQPKSVDRKGTSKSRRDLESINISKLSEKDFNSLTEKEKRILRGDI